MFTRTPDASSDCHAVKPNSMVNSRPPAKRKILNCKNIHLRQSKNIQILQQLKKEGKDSQTMCKKEIKQKLIILQRVTLWNCSDIFVRQDIFVCGGAAILSFTFRNLMVIARLSQNQFPVSAGLVSLSFEQIMKSGRETSWIRLKWGSGST